MDQTVNEILKTIDFYNEILENPKVFQIVDSDYMKKIFQTCIFIENAMRKVQEENKEQEFESHLNAWTLKKKKNIVYKCSNFINACDKLLEFCLKMEKVPNEIIDELLKMYVQQCGSNRLEISINNILTHSMQANAILEIFKNLEISEADIEDEVLINSWEREIELGKQKTIIEYLINMFNQEHIARLIDIAYKAKTKSPVNNLILNFFTRKLTDNHVTLYSELKNSKKKVLLKLIMDNSKFQISFVDTTFYIGRNMEPSEEDVWVTDTGFCYDDLKETILILLDGPEDLYKLIIDRIKLAKELDAVWEDIEKDCIL